MFKVPEKFRKEHPVFGNGDANGGYFVIPITKRRMAHVIASNGKGWEHVSVHVRDIIKPVISIPIWSDMCFIKGVFWDKEDCVVQYHPPESEYVNNHEHVLHLWRQIGKEYDMPDSILVGVK